MRKLSVIFCLFASFVLSANAMAGENVASPRKRVVVLDAGHGGIRSGAYRSKICEKDINLAVAKETRRQLLEKMSDVQVYLTRDIDTQLHENKTADNRRRALFANEMRRVVRVLRDLRYICCRSTSDYWSKIETWQPVLSRMTI